MRGCASPLPLPFAPAVQLGIADPSSDPRVAPSFFPCSQANTANRQPLAVATSGRSSSGGRSDGGGGQAQQGGPPSPGTYTRAILAQAAGLFGAQLRPLPGVSTQSKPARWLLPRCFSINLTTFSSCRFPPYPPTL